MTGNSELVWAVVRLCVALPLVLLLAYVVLKYGLSRRYAVLPGKSRMKLVEQLPLGPKATLSLVALGDKYYLLAHQDNAVSLVKELEELPVTQKVSAEKIMELTPRSVSEIDQYPAGGRPEGIGGPVWERLAQIGSQARSFLTGKRRSWEAKKDRS